MSWRYSAESTEFKDVHVGTLAYYGILWHTMAISRCSDDKPFCGSTCTHLGTESESDEPLWDRFLVTCSRLCHYNVVATLCCDNYHHLWIFAFVPIKGIFIYIYIYIYIQIYISIPLYLYISISLYLYLSTNLPYLYISISLPIYQSTYLPTYLASYLSITITCQLDSVSSEVFSVMPSRRCAHAECRRSADELHELQTCFMQRDFLMIFVFCFSKKFLQEEAVKAATCALLYQSEATLSGCAKFREQGLAAFRAWLQGLQRLAINSAVLQHCLLQIMTASMVHGRPKELWVPFRCFVVSSHMVSKAVARKIGK